MSAQSSAFSETARFRQSKKVVTRNSSLKQHKNQNLCSIYYPKHFLTLKQSSQNKTFSSAHEILILLPTNCTIQSRY